MGVGHRYICLKTQLSFMAVFRREDLYWERLRGPSPIMPSDIEYLVRELQLLKAEVQKIKKALEEWGIKID